MTDCASQRRPVLTGLTDWLAPHGMPRSSVGCACVPFLSPAFLGLRCPIHPEGRVVVLHATDLPNPAASRREEPVAQVAYTLLPQGGWRISAPTLPLGALVVPGPLGRTPFRVGPLGRTSLAVCPYWGLSVTGVLGSIRPCDRTVWSRVDTKQTFVRSFVRSFVSYRSWSRRMMRRNGAKILDGMVRSMA